MLATALSIPLLTLNLAYAPIWDSEMPDGGELLPNELPNSNLQNGYEIIEAFFNESGLTSPHPELKKWIQEPDSFAPKQREQLIRDLSPYQSLFRKLQKEVHYFPDVSYEAVKTLNFMALRDLAWYRQLLVHQALQEKNPEMAIRHIQEAIQFSLALSGKRGSMIHEMIASMMLGIALEDAQKTLASFPEYPPSALIRELHAIPDMRRTGWKMLQGEASFMQDYLTKHTVTPTFKQAGIALLTGDFTAWWLDLPAPSLLFHPHRSTGYYFEFYRSWHLYLHTDIEHRNAVQPPKQIIKSPSISNYIGIQVFNRYDFIRKPIEVLQEKEAHSHAIILMTFLSRNQTPPNLRGCAIFC